MIVFRLLIVAVIVFSTTEPTSKRLVGHVPVDSGSACFIDESTFSSHITTPVTEEMEKEILTYLGKYDKYPALSVKTNNVILSHSAGSLHIIY